MVRHSHSILRMPGFMHIYEFEFAKSMFIVNNIWFSIFYFCNMHLRTQEIKFLIYFMYIFYRSHRLFFIIKGCQCCKIKVFARCLRLLSMERIYIIHYPLWHRASVYIVSSERQTNLVASYDEPGYWGIFLSWFIRKLFFFYIFQPP